MIDVHVYMAKLTLINCAEENIEEHTNEKRIHRHLPTETRQSNNDMTFIFNSQATTNQISRTQAEGG